MPPTVGAALIVRNEESFIEGCLQSIADAVDEIVLVDTGSTDRTVAIAHAAGARILDFPWRDDFAAARNHGLEAARSDWILYIDADERLSVPAGIRLSDALAAPGAIAARVRFHPRLRTTPYREIRLFRRDPRIRFAGAIHETMMPALDALREAGEGCFVDSDATITHLGYEGDLSAKHRRNLPLLRAAILRDPERLYYWNHLAETLEAIGEAGEALEVAARGLATARTKSQTAGVRMMKAVLALTHARLLRLNGADGLATIEEGLAARPGHCALLFLKARILVDRGRHAEALALLDGWRFSDPAAFADPEIAYDERIFGAHAHDLAGIALLRLGRRAEAAAAFRLAAASEPGDPSYRIKASALGA
jgi:tetratricopeptide (TPR) repeat protein